MSSSTELKGAAIVRYYTGDATPRGGDYDGIAMVKAVKGRTFNNFFYYGGKKYDQTNAEEFAANIAPAEMAKSILGRIANTATLVPIPNSHVIAENTEGFRTLSLAQRIAAMSAGRLTAVPALVFKEPQAKSSENGPRAASHFEQAYKLIYAIDGPIVLVDDVTTLGGHFVGACWKLAGIGASVEMASAFASTTHDQVPSPLAEHDFTYDLRRPSDIFAAFFQPPGQIA